MTPEMQQDPVTLTPAAEAYLSKSIANRKHGVGIRLSVLEKGCNGFRYHLEYVDAPKDSDLKFPVSDPTGNLALYVERESYPYVKGTQIDYVQQGLNGKYVFLNPQSQGNCGCGESFNL